MLNPRTGALRICRALALGISCLFVTLLGHDLAAGHSSATGLALVGVLMICAAGYATSRELSTRSLLAFLAVLQAVSHVLLSLLMPMAATAPAVAGAAGSAEIHGHSGMGSMTMPAGSASGGASVISFDRLGLSWTMLAAHAIACLILALLLRQGEAVAFRLHEALPRIMNVLLGRTRPRPATVLPVVIRVRKLVTEHFFEPVQLLIAREVPRRGPPSAFVNS